jgi:hypothetical protein
VAEATRETAVRRGLSGPFFVAYEVAREIEIDIEIDIEIEIQI